MMMCDWGTGELEVTLQKERVMEFFSKGKARPMDGKLWALAALTLPDSIKNNPRALWDGKGMGDDPAPRDYYNGQIRAEGVVVTKDHKVLFYALLNDRVLDITDDSDGECALVLGPDAGTSAPWLKLYNDYPHAGEAEFYQGKMPTHRPQEIARVVNRTDGDLDIHLPVSQKRIRKFLTEGKPDLQEADSGMKESGYFILPKKIDPAILPKMQKMGVIGTRWGNMARADGVMILRNGEPIFWSLRNDFVLWLCDSQHRTCALKLGDESPDGNDVAHFSINGHGYETAAPIESIMREPDWMPGDKTPPLSEDKAVKIAKEELMKITGDKTLPLWRVSKIELLPAMETPKKWCYTVRFIKPLPAKDMSGLSPGHREVYGDDAVIFVSLEGKPGKIEDLGNGE